MVERSGDRLPLLKKPTTAPAELREAIANLETIAHSDLSPLARMVNLGRRFVAACFSKKSQDLVESGTQERLINAIGVIKAHYLQNQPIEKGLKASTIHLEPKVHSGVATPSSSKIARLSAPWREVSNATCQATPRELDLFRVKAISLMRAYVMQNNLLEEALDAIRNTPIVPESSQDDGESGTITLTQTIQLFPERFVLQGSFQRNAHSKVTSIPLSGSFQLYNSGHTGHPRPHAHNGWALSEHLLANELDSADLPVLRGLLSKKRLHAQSLQVGGALVSRAKQIINSQQEAFHSDVPKYLALHASLASQILIASGLPEIDAEPVQAYFAWLATRVDAYSQLSQLYEILNEVFLGTEGDYACWLASQESHPAIQFIGCLGPILAKGSREPHSLFGRQLLHALYRQLWSFQCALESDACPPLADSLAADHLCFVADPLESITTIPQQAVAEHVLA